MKSAKVMLGFLLVAFTTIALVGCKHAVTEQELDKTLAKYNKANSTKQDDALKTAKKSAWNSFYNTIYGKLISGGTVTKDTINTAVEKFNKAQAVNGGKFSTDTYAVVTYTKGTDLAESDYKLATNDVYTSMSDKISHHFSIEIKRRENLSW